MSGQSHLSAEDLWNFQKIAIPLLVCSLTGTCFLQVRCNHLKRKFTINYVAWDAVELHIALITFQLIASVYVFYESCWSEQRFHYDGNAVVDCVVTLTFASQKPMKLASESSWLINNIFKRNFTFMYNCCTRMFPQTRWTTIMSIYFVCFLVWILYFCCLLLDRMHIYLYLIANVNHYYVNHGLSIMTMSSSFYKNVCLA